MTSELQTTQRNTNGSQAATPDEYLLPLVDVFEHEAGLTFLADLPGVTKDGLGVRVDGDSLVIEGKVQTPGPENMQLIYGEAQIAAYRRQFILSRDLDRNKIDAKLKDGVLRLTIPKAE